MIQFKKDRITQLAEQTAGKCGFEIYDIVIQFRKQTTKIDVRIDNGAVVSHDDCALFSREFTIVLDNEESLVDYFLEVSSPGLKRKLRNREELQRYVDSPIKVSYHTEKGVETIKGTLISVVETAIAIKVERKTVTIEIDDIKSANLDY